jgi:hypothetical protein
MALVAGQAAYSDETLPLEIPLISTSANVLFREDFRRITSIIAKSDVVSGHQAGRFAIPYSGKTALVLWNLSYGYFYPLADWLYVPLYGAFVMGYGYEPVDVYNYSLLAGTGFVLNFDIAALGVGLDYSTNSIIMGNGGYAIASDFPEYIKMGFALYPEIKTENYPVLGVFLKSIIGEFTVKETGSSDTIFENIAWVSRLVFKDILRIPVFDLYAKSGKNDFFPEYDMSESYTGFNTYTYGGVVGTETLTLEANYSLVTGSYIMGRDSTITESQKKKIHYPFGLNGFPSLTMHWRPDEELYFYLRLSTAQGMFFLSEEDNEKYPVIPTVGVACYTFEYFRGNKAVLLFSFTIPFAATMAVQMYF